MDDNPYVTPCETGAGRVRTAPTLCLFAVAWFLCVWSESGLFAFVYLSEYEPPATGLLLLILLAIALFGGPLFAIAAPWHWLIKVTLSVITPFAIIAQWIVFFWLLLAKDGLAGTQ